MDLREVATAADHAAVEGLSALFRRIAFISRRCITRDELELVLVTQIKCNLHHRHRQPAFVGLSRKELETIRNSALVVHPYRSSKFGESQAELEP